jgi:WD40 repeat protein
MIKAQSVIVYLGAAAILSAIIGSSAAVAQGRLEAAGRRSAELVPRVGHANAVTALAYSPDGRYIVSVAKDRSGRVWDGKSGALLRTLTGVGSPLIAVAFAANSRTVVTAARDGSVQWWNATSGKRLGRTAARAAKAEAVALHPGGADGLPLLIATGNAAHSISLEIVKRIGGPGEPAARLEGNVSRVLSIALSPDGKLAASGGEDGSVRVWETVDGLVRFSLRSHAMPVRAIAFSADSTVLADASDDGDTHRWDTRTGKKIGSRLQLNAPGDGVGAVAFGPDASLIATGGRRSLANRQAYAVIWSGRDELQKQALVGHEAYVTALAFSPDGTRLASGSRDRSVRVWSTESGRQIAPAEMRVAVTSVAFSPTARILAGASTDSAVRIWSARTGELLHILLGHRGAVNAVAFTPDGRRIVSGGSDHTIRVWDAATGAPLHAWTSKSGEIDALRVSPDGSLVITGHRSSAVAGAIEIRELETGAVRRTLDGLPPIRSLAISPDGATLGAGSGNSSGLFENPSEVRLWDLKSGEQAGVNVAAMSYAVNALAYSPDGRLLASAADHYEKREDYAEDLSGDMKVWNGRTLAYHHGGTLPLAGTFVNALMFLPDNQTIVSGGEDGLIRRWNARTGESAGVFPAEHQGPVTSLSLSPDGALLASGSADNTVRIWNAKTSMLLITLTTLPTTAGVANGEAPPSTDWLAATPAGYYDGSANACRQVLWRDGEDLFPVDAFEAIRHKPDELRQALLTETAPAPPAPETVPPKFGSLTHGIGLPRPASASHLLVPPQITFAEPVDGAQIGAASVRVSGWVTDPDHVVRLRFEVNGRLLATKPLTMGAKPLTMGAKPLTMGAKPLTVGAKPLTMGAKDIPAGHRFYQPFQADLPLSTADSQVAITVVAEDADHLTSREALHLTHPATAGQGVLHVLSVGVSRYANPHFDLKYARSDAEAFGAMWQQHSGGLYKEVRVTRLVDEDATATNVRAALFKLAEQAAAGDCVAIFLSGHGVQDGDRYYFATREIEPTHERIEATALPWTALQTALGLIQARRVVLFLDACHSGNALGGMQANSERIAEVLVKRSGVMVFASSRGTEYSYELDDRKHGAFTEALLEGIGEAKANLDIGGQRADTISAEDLLAYLRRRVPQLTNNRQTPACPLIRDFGDAFPLVRVR